MKSSSGGFGIGINGFEPSLVCWIKGNQTFSDRKTRKQRKSGCSRGEGKTNQWKETEFRNRERVLITIKAMLMYFQGSNKFLSCFHDTFSFLPDWAGVDFIYFNSRRTLVGIIFLQTFLFSNILWTFLQVIKYFF